MTTIAVRKRQRSPCTSQNALKGALCLIFALFVHRYLAGETVQHEALPTLLYEGQSDLGAPEVKPTTTKGVPKSKPSVDMISVGSLKNPRRVQEDTFVRFVSVRNYWLFTEDDDDDDCSSTLTREDVRDIIQFCHANTTYPKLRLVSRHFSSSESLLEKQPDPPGWLCAQKRPIVALFKVLMHYYEANTLPDYLFVMDDDSWFRMDLVLPYLLTEHPADEAHVVAGCLIRSQYDWNYTWYWGGFGVILTRRAVQRLLQPIWCDGRASNAFQDHACDQLEQDLLGERSFFTPGMNLVSLMYAYSREQSYLAHKGWNVGYCVHSDMALAYFFNMYHIGVKPKESDLSPLKSAHFDRISAFNGTSVHKTRKVPGKVYKSYGYCLIRNGNLCTTESHLCHYTPEKRMEYLFRQIVEEVPAMYAET